MCMCAMYVVVCVYSEWCVSVYAQYMLLYMLILVLKYCTFVGAVEVLSQDYNMVFATLQAGTVLTIILRHSTSVCVYPTR